MLRVRLPTGCASGGAVARCLYRIDHRVIADRARQDAVAAAAAQAGLDLPRARGVIGSPAVLAEIGKNLQMAGALGLTGTPSWVIGDRVLSGAIGYDAMVDAIKAARDRAS